MYKHILSTFVSGLCVYVQDKVSLRIKRLNDTINDDFLINLKISDKKKAISHQKNHHEIVRKQKYHEKISLLSRKYMFKA